MSEPTRHFATVPGRHGTRQVHYRRAGRGPALVLLHQSPQSSREYEPLMRQWAADFTVFAPDAPGYGYSDPLPDPAATMEDFADAVREFADAIGLQRFGVYGYHTGGSMAVALAHACPDRVSAAAVNGLVMLTPDELDNILANYLPAFAPRWDGGHLAWLWARLREQTIFFPWHDRRLATRMDFTMHDPVQLQTNLLEFLRAGDHYRVAYRAAFAYRAGPVLPQVRVPLLVTAAAADPLAAHLDRIADRPDCVKVERSADHGEALNRALGHLLNYPGDAPGDAPTPDDSRTGARNAILPAAGGELRARHWGTAPRALVLHDAGGSVETAAPLARALGDAVAIDLPGHGGTEGRVAADAPDLGAAADAALAALDTLPAPPRVVAGEGAGACVALELARRAAPRVAALVLKDLPLLDDADRDAFRAEGLPALAPDWHGGHLSRAWHLVRDRQLYFPWFRRTRVGIRWIEPRLDDAGLQLELRELLRAEGHWQALARAQLDMDIATALADCRAPVLLCAAGSSPHHDAMRTVAARLPGARFLTLPEDPAGWPAALAPLIEAWPAAATPAPAS